MLRSPDALSEIDSLELIASQAGLSIPAKVEIQGSVNAWANGAKAA